MAKEKEKRSRGKDWDEVPQLTEGKKFDSELDFHNFSEDSHTQLRLVGKVFSVKLHWVPTIRKDGSRAQFPKLCLHNDEDAESCPYCKIGLATNTRYFTNAIIRDLEESRPRKAKFDKNARFKKKGDDNWTPIRVVSFPASVMQKILNFKSLTKVKTSEGLKTYHVSDVKYGRDLNIMLDSSGTGSGRYDVQREQVSALEGEERYYLQYDIDSVYDAIESEEEAIQVIKSLYERGVFEGAVNREGKSLVNISEVMKLLGIDGKKKSKKSYDEDDEDDLPKKKKKKRYEEEEDDDVDFEEEEEEEEDEDEEEDTPRRKKSSKKKKRPVEDDEDDEEDDDVDFEEEEEEDEDDEPRKNKSSKKSKKSPRKQSSKDEDEDEDDLDMDDDEEDEEEEEETPRKKKSSKKSKKSSSNRSSKDEDDDDDEIIEDDEEEDTPRRKKSPKKKRPVEDDEDEDDEDDVDLEEEEDDEDDEEEEESPRRKKSSKKPKKSSGRRSSKDDDDLDIEDDEEEEEEEAPRRKKSSKKRK